MVSIYARHDLFRFGVSGTSNNGWVEYEFKLQVSLNVHTGRLIASRPWQTH